MTWLQKRLMGKYPVQSFVWRCPLTCCLYLWHHVTSPYTLLTKNINLSVYVTRHSHGPHKNKKKKMFLCEKILLQNDIKYWWIPMNQTGFSVFCLLVTSFFISWIVPPVCNGFGPDPSKHWLTGPTHQVQRGWRSVLPLMLSLFTADEPRVFLLRSSCCNQASGCWLTSALPLLQITGTCSSWPELIIRP